MEFVEGGSLAHLIARGPMPPRVAAGHAVCICEFLDKAHQFLTIEGEPGQPDRARRSEAAAHPAAAAGRDPRARFRHREGAGQDAAGHHEHLGHDLLRVARTARVWRRESLRGLLVPRRDALRDGGGAPTVRAPREEQPAARTRHPHERAPRAAARLVPAAAGGHHQQAARLPAGAPVSDMRPPSGPICRRSCRIASRRPPRNTRLRRPRRSIGRPCRCLHNRRPIACRRPIPCRSPA